MSEERKLVLPEPENFIEREINSDLEKGINTEVYTRFPP